VIRSRFGVEGLREDRRLRAAMAESTRRWRHLTALHATLVGKPGIAAWWKRKKVVWAIKRNVTESRKLSLRVRALLDPQFDVLLRKALTPGIAKRAANVVRLRWRLRRVQKQMKRAPRRIDGEVAA
jgi:hypothetical protein